MSIDKKLRKHVSITHTRLNQKAELAKISNYDNRSLHKVISALTVVKNQNFSKEDRQAFQSCENYRSELLRDNTQVSYAIFGSEKSATVKDICKNAASGPIWCQFLYYLSKNLVPSNILEIGTNLGVSGTYTLKSIRHYASAKLITMEGLPQLCEISGKQFALMAPNYKFDIRQGLFNSTFPELLAEDVQFDLLFIDGNHQKEPTLSYFNSLKDKISSTAVFVFDDINWSGEMQETWEIIKNDDQVNFAIDLYKQGIVIIDKKESAKNVQFSLHLTY